MSYEWAQRISDYYSREVLEENSRDKIKNPSEISRMEKELNRRLLVSMFKIESKKESTDLTNFSDKEKSLIKAFSTPATKETILAHLMKTTAHLHIKGGGECQSAFLLHDYTTRLFEAKALEVDLFLALEHFIETEEFFPSYAKLHKQIFGKPEEKKKHHDIGEE